MKIFEGDGIALMIIVYKNEALPLNIRIQCAMAASPFERPRLNAIAGRFTLERADSGGEDAGDALIEAILRRVQVAEKKYQPPPEITPPEPAPAGTRRGPRRSTASLCNTQQTIDPLLRRNRSERRASLWQPMGCSMGRINCRRLPT
jgi:hypothetical protein